MVEKAKGKERIENYEELEGREREEEVDRKNENEGIRG